MSERTIVRFALLGVGRIGAIRAELIHSNPHAHLEYIIDTNLVAAHQLASLYGSKVSDKLEDALPHVDAVWISTSTATHPAFIKAAAAAKKPVATEKPVAFQIEEIEECFDACEKNGVPLLVGFHRRNDPHFVKFKNALEKHKPAHIIRIVNRDHPLPAPEQFVHLGSIFEDFLIHDFDSALWLVGGAPDRIYSVGKQMLPGLQGTTVLDTALVSISYPNGTQVSIEASRYSAGGLDQRLEAITQNATLMVNNPLRSELVVIDSERNVHDVFEYSFPQRYYEAYKNEVQHFIDVIISKVKPKVSREDCVLVARMVQAAAKSHEEKRHVIFSADGKSFS